MPDLGTPGTSAGAVAALTDLDPAELTARWESRQASDDPAAAGAETLRDAVLRELRQGLDGQARSPRTRDLRGIRLIAQDLTGLDLQGCDLSGADLSRSDLSGCKLSRARLVGSVLFGTNLSGANLLMADLSGANLSECRAERTAFGAANLTGALLFSADLTEATLSKAVLAGADLRAARLDGARLRESDLRGANFAKASMCGAELEQSDVTSADFTDASLRGADLRRIAGYPEANWIGADIHEVNFHGAYLIRREIMDQNFLFEFRTLNRYNALLYKVWWATSDCGRSFARWGLWTVLIAGVFAGVYELVDMDYGDHRTYLSSLYYSVVTLTTLGYGDVLPASAAAQFVAMLEVAVGYVMLGGLMSIFANKMARRAD